MARMMAAKKTLSRKKSASRKRPPVSARPEKNRIRNARAKTNPAAHKKSPKKKTIPARPGPLKKENAIQDKIIPEQTVSGILREGKLSFSIPDGVFYNPEMEYCRDLSSLCVGAIGSELRVADCFTASGVRGLRYLAENGNVEKLALVDYSEKSCAAARENAKKNKLDKKAIIVSSSVEKFLLSSLNEFNLVELDPFGSPAPFIENAFHIHEIRLDFACHLCAGLRHSLCNVAGNLAPRLSSVG